MSGADGFRRMFAGADLEIEDLYLLEAFQIGYLPGWLPEAEFSKVLHAYPAIKRFLAKRNPDVASYLDRLTAQYRPAASTNALAIAADRIVWTIADLLVYSKCPEIYDRLAFHDWDWDEVTSITSLEGKTVIDAGSGTGRVALKAARNARLVFAVEPVARLRRFIQEKAVTEGLRNLFVIDGFSHAIPLPDGFADVLITSHALGWRLDDELREFERVVRAGGHIIHCPGTAENESEEPQHRRLISEDWGYRFAHYREADGSKRKYWKEVRALASGRSQSASEKYTPTQGQYLAYIYHYTKLHGRPPAEADMQSFFQTSPPSVHQMVVRLEERGFIARVPGQPRSIRVLLPARELPELERK
jgi:ubiquinone/menaquinone biosynthesis C-methylase UbiE